jgi:5-methylcytosine-specific restriction protein A
MIPNRRDIKKELVNFLKDSGSITPSEAYSALSEFFKLSVSDLEKKTNDGDNFFEKEVRWAKKDLVDDSIIKRAILSGRGVWELATPAAEIEEDLNPILAYSIGELGEALSKTASTAKPPIGQRTPARVSTASETYVRDVRVVAYVLKESEGKCEACNKPSPFNKTNGLPYLEVHHLRRLADGGSDTVQNAIAACPNCHRELHYGENKDAIKSFVFSKIGRIIEE